METKKETDDEQIENFSDAWHKLITKNHTCIWSDKWEENLKNQQES